MVIEQPLEKGQPRRKVWCLMKHLEANDNGTYKFKNLNRTDLGYGSLVKVVDSPNLILLYDDTTGELYDWTNYLNGGEPD